MGTASICTKRCIRNRSKAYKDEMKFNKNKIIGEIMKKIKIAILVIVLLIVIFIVGYKIYEYSIEFRLDDVNKYLVTTDTRFLTMRNDGGSHENIYYGVDLDKGKVTKYEESVKVYLNLGFSTDITKITFNKNLEENDVEELRILLNNIYLDTNNEENNTQEERNILQEGRYTLSSLYHFYTVSNISYGEIEVYNDEFKQKFLNIVEK